MAKKDDKPIVIITGSSGNIGNALTKALKDAYHVVGFDRSIENSDIPFDLTSKASLTTAFKLFKEQYGRHIAAVIHLAAYFDFTGKDSPLYEAINETGTKNLLHALNDFEVERFIYPSTMLVHKPCAIGETINENSDIAPKWAYPVSKAHTETIIKKHHGKHPYLILRLAGMYDEKTCIPTLANQIARVYERDIKSHLYAGNINAGQSFIHQEDLIELFKLALKHRNDLPEEEVLLAGEPHVISYEKLQSIITHLLHEEKSEIYKVPALAAKTGAWIEEQSEPFIPDDFDQGKKPFIRPFMIDLASDQYALDVSKAEKTLGWKPKHAIEDTLPRIIAHLQANPTEWYEKNGVLKPDWMLAVPDENAEHTRKTYEQQFRKLYQRNLWTHFLNAALGIWLMSSPPLLGYESFALSISDVVSGVLLTIGALFCLSWRMSSIRWICALIGLWLLFAPLIFWAPTAGAYLNDTLIGALIIGFSIGMRPDVGVAPNAAVYGPDVPPGWSFSPSSWFQRLPIIFLALVGFFLSRYMAAYQLGHIDNAWDPFFIGAVTNDKNGTEEIITSSVSQAWPVPDAGLGAAVYILEILTGVIGGANRWRTMPWLVMLFGVLIVPLGVVSITFIIIQPIVLNTWCTLCLLAAVAMLIQIPYSFDELIATSTFLWRRWKAGRPLLRIFFVGDNDEVTQHSKTCDDFAKPPAVVLKEMISGGVSLPWNLGVCLLIGLWLMSTRMTLNAEGSMANADHLIGCLVIAVTVMALAESVRFLRFINLFFALALFVTPVIYDAGYLAMIVSFLCGGLLLILSVPRGRMHSSYGSWNKFII